MKVFAYTFHSEIALLGLFYLFFFFEKITTITFDLKEMSEFKQLARKGIIMSVYSYSTNSK